MLFRFATGTDLQLMVSVWHCMYFLFQRKDLYLKRLWTVYKGLKKSKDEGRTVLIRKEGG